MERPTSAGQRLAPIGATQGQSSDADAESIADKYFVCTECLIGGHVQSFIELFYLTHLTQQSAASIENQKASNEISSGTLHFLKQILTRAENSQRSGDLLAVVDSYKALAEHYEAEDDHRTALYFTEKCLEVSKLCGDKRAEVEANRLLGFCHEHLGNAELSLKHHEVQRDIARSLADSEEILDANRHLIDAYKSAAEQCERQGQYEKAVALHEQCMESSRASGDDLSAGLAYFQLGRTYKLLGDTAKSLEHYNMYLQLCKNIDDKVGEGQACSALASAHEAAGEASKAVSFLEIFYELSQMTGELASQEEACTRLGKIFFQSQDYNNSVRYFEKAFEMARSLGDQKSIGTARINLGIARAHAKLSSYLKVANGNLPALLKWKNRRTPFDV